MSVWAFNVTTMAATEYRNMPFDSLITRKGVTFGVLPDGLYVLQGADDEGEPIEAHVRTGLLDLGTEGRKAVRKAALYVKSDQLVYLKVVYDDGGTRSEIWYELAAASGDPLHHRRVDIGRGAKGSRWAFEVSNVDGGELDLRGLDVFPVVLARRDG